MSYQALISRTGMGEIGVTVLSERASPFDGVPLFCIMRNETYFLPHFLAHYRSIGITNFQIYLDSCDEEFVAMLEAESDVSLLTSSRYRFGDVLYTTPQGIPVKLGHFLKESISNELMLGRWHAVVDADEFLILPPPMKAVAEYIAFLEERGQMYSFAPMVDFYPRRLRDRNHATHVAPFMGSPYFDAGPYHQLHPVTKQLLTINGGVRGRILEYLRRNSLAELGKAGIRGSDLKLPTNFKFPLLKTDASLKRFAHHWINQQHSLDNMSCIAHFKFYPGLDWKLSVARAEGQYFRSSIEYKILKVAIDVLGDADLVFENSVAYTSPADLVTARILR